MFDSEKNLLLLIKIVPITVIVLFSMVATYFAIKENTLDYNQKLIAVQQDVYKEAKQRIKEEVLRVHDTINFEKSTTTEQLKHSIKQRVYEAHSILTRIYNENKTKNTVQIKKIMKDALNDIRFNHGRGYYFLYEMNGKNILLPPNKALEGKSFWNFKDAKGVYTIRGMANVVKQHNEGFYTWYWYKPGNKKVQYKKIGFGKYFAPFDWFIGTGEYIKDFEDDIKQRLLQRINYIRYNKDGYICVYDYDGNTLAHIDKQLLGKNILNLKNSDIPIQKLISTAQQGEGFINYNNTKEEKIFFTKGINEWKWAVGSVLYTNELQKQILKRADEIKKNNETSIHRIFLFSISLTIAFLILSLTMTHFAKKIFFKYKTNMAKRDQQLAEQAKHVAMGEMIGNIAHQWRQPLSVISTASTGMRLQQEADILVEEDILKLCDTINDNAQYLSKTIDDFTNFIKGERTKIQFNLSHSIDSFLHLMEGTIKNNNIEIKIDIDKSIELYGYPNELVQGLINIFNNAKDALKEINGERYFFINTEILNNNKVKIFLRDNAGGIPQNIMNRIFEPYFTTKHKSQGTGLGLSMTHNLIVNGMNGKINVKNVTYGYQKMQYTGAEFIITLKLK